MPQENDKSPDMLQFPLPLRLKKKTEYGQMTHQTKACKPQETKKITVSSSAVVPRLHCRTLFYPFKRRSRRYGAPHETLRTKCHHIVFKIPEKNDRARCGSGPSMTCSLFYTPRRNNYLICMSTFWKMGSTMMPWKFCLEQN